MTDRSPRQIASVATACEIVEVLRQLDGGTVSEVAAHVDRTPGTVHTHLSTLATAHYVVKEGDTYKLSPRFITLGDHVRNHSKLHNAAVDEVDQLAEETGEVVNLMTEYNGLKVGLYQAFGENAVGTDYHVKTREQPERYLHYSASGKAILAASSEERAREILDGQELVRRTENTITDREALLEELERIRERGFAQNDEEQVLGLRAVGAPITDTDGSVLGAISLSAPTRRLQGERFDSEVPELIINAANLVELNIQTAE